MKRISFAAAALAALTCSAIYGQTPNLRANIPFAFYAGKAMLPAGSYTIHDSNHVLWVSADPGGKSAMVLTNGAYRVAPADTGQLVFHRYGSSYFLSRIWAPGAREGVGLGETRQEKELARNTRPIETAVVSVVFK